MQFLLEHSCFMSSLVPCPRPKPVKLVKVNHFVTEFGPKVLTKDGIVLICMPCGGMPVNSSSKFIVEQRLKANKHFEAVERAEKWESNYF